MTYTHPITTLIRRRYSCRSYDPHPITEEKCRHLADFIATLPDGPFSAPNHFLLATATAQDNSALRDLGTYGFIKNSPGFIIGATQPGNHDLEDFGYRMEKIVLQATDLGLETCWLGGTFTRSGFSRKISLAEDEILPAVCSVGLPALQLSDDQIDTARYRFDWKTFFFDGDFGTPLSPEDAGNYAISLEMVRLAPSASNKQPWRIVRQDNRFHFYIQRTKGYRELSLTRWTGIADMQRVDSGIAMAHFELAAIETGLTGRWQVSEPDLAKPDNLTEYSASWVSS
jgi:hypothetical protein